MALGETVAERKEGSDLNQDRNLRIDDFDLGLVDKMVNKLGITRSTFVREINRFRDFFVSAELVGPWGSERKLILSRRGESLFMWIRHVRTEGVKGKDNVFDRAMVLFLKELFETSVRVKAYDALVEIDKGIRKERDELIKKVNELTLRGEKLRVELMGTRNRFAHAVNDKTETMDRFIQLLKIIASGEIHPNAILPLVDLVNDRWIQEKDAQEADRLVSRIDEILAD